MKKYLAALLLVSLGSYAYTYEQAPCRRPIAYAIRSFDNRFNIPEDEFRSAVHDAESLWEKAAGKELFKEDPKGSLAVNLIYDERQATSDKNKTLFANLDQTKETAGQVKTEYTLLEAKYETLIASYKKDLPKGGRDLESRRQEINALAAEINTLIKKYNSLVDQANQKVATINESAGQEFNEGEYISDEAGRSINIYEFTTRPELVRVLAHEFGHALGLDHNANPDSIMYYLNQSENGVPTAEDTASLALLCGQK
ncbi:MAG: hypothetical protein JWN89_281 [Parcubacteria group bacterium]|nr:hypothetical protein [Parcubacteria group bacterium]